MKRTVIGTVFMFIGLFICLTIIVLAIIQLPHIDTWRGQKLWFTIFGATDLGNSQSLFLGIPFVAGVILFLCGLLMLSIEYFNSRK